MTRNITNLKLFLLFVHVVGVVDKAGPALDTAARARRVSYKRVCAIERVAGTEAGCIAQVRMK